MKVNHLNVQKSVVNMSRNILFLSSTLLYTVFQFGMPAVDLCIASSGKVNKSLGMERRLVFWQTN